jgi:hypothetical protein
MLGIDKERAWEAILQLKSRDLILTHMRVTKVVSRNKVWGDAEYYAA